MNFEQWWKREYPKLADGQTSFKDALEAAFEAGRDYSAEVEASYP